MKRHLRRICALVMTVTMLLSVTGCDKKESKDDSTETEKRDTKEMVFQGEDCALDGIKGDINSVFVQDGNIYLNTCEWIEDMDETSVEHLYAVNIDGNNVRELIMPELGDSQRMQLFAIGKDGTVVYLINNYDSKKEQSTYTLLKMDEQGNELINEDVTKLFNVSENNYISGMLLDENGKVVVSMEQSVYILADDYKSTDEIKLESYLEGMAKTKDGQIVCGTTVYSGEEGCAQIQVLDVENKKWGETYKLDVQYFSGSDSLINGVDYDVFYKDDSGIYGYDMIEKKSTKIMDYVASYISSDNSWGITAISKDEFIGISYDENGTELVKYSKVDPSDIKDKITITFGAMWIDEQVKKQAIEFNKTNNKYRIEFKDYSEEEDPVTKMNADIIAGDVPDILSLNSLPYEQYIAKGMLEDLTPYLEQDEELSKDDIIDSVYNAMETDGKLYYLAPSFGISTIVARTSDVGNESGWTFDELKEVLKNNSDARPFYLENKSEMLDSFLGTGVNDFIDWQSGKCSFESQDFKDILEICNQGTNEAMEYNEDSPSMPTLIQEGKVLFAEGWISPEEVEIYKKMFGEEVTFIGYPNQEKESSYFQFDNALAIYSKSEVKEGAWEFIRSFMTKEYQGNSMDMYNAPVRKDCFDMMIKAKTTTETYTDEFGQEITPLDSTWGWDDLNVAIGPLTQEEADIYIALVNNTKKVASSDESIMEIVQEEAKVYFAGEKSLDETVKIIQNRVQTYVNENR